MFWRSLHRKTCALSAVRPVCVQHHEHDRDGTDVAVPVMTAYRGSGIIFLLFLTTALYGVSSTLGNYWIRPGRVQGWILAFLEIWNSVQPTANSPVTPDCLRLVQTNLRIAEICAELCASYNSVFFFNIRITC